MCQIDIFMHVQYRYSAAHHSNKLDKTAVLVVGVIVFMYVYRVDTIIVVHVLLLRLSIKLVRFKVK
jgi:hypothetical protein